VIVGRNRIKQGGPLHAIVINNKVSNVCSGGDGVADSETVCAAVAKALNLPGGASTVLPSSTGVIGWRLPAAELAGEVVPEAVSNLQTVSALNAAKAICTTDRFPKVRSKTLSTGARLVGIVKGAGMIEPNMATMLVRIACCFCSSLPLARVLLLCVCFNKKATHGCTFVLPLSLGIFDDGCNHLQRGTPRHVEGGR
jgi:N-acetylglutamate synthase/N-acetylornithine aminotransferase